MEDINNKAFDDELNKAEEEISESPRKKIPVPKVNKDKKKKSYSQWENDRIMFLCPELIPSKYATTDWMFEQEMNLKYVAITRAKKDLIYISGETFKSDIKSKNYI